MNSKKAAIIENTNQSLRLETKKYYYTLNEYQKE
jgi:hypothetical protein